jgi:hypothetical protein
MHGAGDDFGAQCGKAGNGAQFASPNCTAVVSGVIWQRALLAALTALGGSPNRQLLA